jgi:hypothetical protein
LPAVGTTPYDQCENVLQLARAMANDAALSIAGNVLSDTQPYVFILLDGAFRALRKMLTSEGVSTFSKTVIVQGLTPVAAPGGIVDPTIQVQLSYTGYYDGVLNHGNPTLPPDLLEPLELWERQNGTQNKWNPLRPASDSINTSSQGTTFGEWLWETDILFLPGATLTNDIKIKYLYKMAMLTAPNQPVPIKDCMEALAALFVAFAARSRGGSAVAADYEAQARIFVKGMVNPTARREGYANFQRKPFRSHGGRGHRR